MLPTGTFLAVSPFITASVLGSLFAFTVVFVRRAELETMLPAPAPEPGPAVAPAPSPADEGPETPLPPS
jgi:hypothetical protein